MAKKLKKKKSYSSLDKFSDPSLANSLLSSVEDYQEIKPLPREIPAREIPAIKVKPTRIIKSEPKKEARGVLLEQKITKQKITEQPTKLPTNKPTGELANVKREIVLTPSTAKAFDELESILSTAINSSLTRSHVARAVFSAIKDSLGNIATEAMKLPPMKRPSNAKGFEADRDKFEAELARVIKNGVGASGTVKR